MITFPKVPRCPGVKDESCQIVWHVVEGKLMPNGEDHSLGIDLARMYVAGGLYNVNVARCGVHSKLAAWFDVDRAVHAPDTASLGLDIKLAMIQYA